ncbi:hypothetical protein LCGC14_0386620, partial [marine sediment metagenome]
MGQARVTQAGVYIEQGGDAVVVTQAGVYVEITQLPPTGGPGIWVIYDGTDITAQMHSIRLEAAINQWDATDFASTGAEFGSGLAKWRLPLKGHWEPDWDGVVMPDAVTPPITPKDVTVYIWDRTTAVRVGYFWEGGGVIKR